jgi:hypothetical protein
MHVLKQFVSLVYSLTLFPYRLLLSINQRISFLYSTVSDAIPLDIIGYVGTIFWILGTFGPRVIDPTKAPYLGDYTGIIGPSRASAWAISLALGIHIVFPIVYTVAAGPFNLRADWYPLSTDSKVHRAKMRDELRLESGGRLQIVVPVEVIEETRSYEIEFGSTTPLDIQIIDEPNDDQDWDRKEKILSSDELVHDTFTPVFLVEAEDDLGTGGNHHIRIENNGFLRRRTLLEIPVVE